MNKNTVEVVSDEEVVSEDFAAVESFVLHEDDTFLLRVMAERATPELRATIKGAHSGFVI